MATKVKPSAQARAFGSAGIFGPDWHKWRGAIMRIELDGEPPFVARFDDVRSLSGASATADQARTASLTILDEHWRPTTARTIPWPPAGTVRVLRSP